MSNLSSTITRPATVGRSRSDVLGAVRVPARHAVGARISVLSGMGVVSVNTADVLTTTLVSCNQSA
jgi:hypothetical protein